MLWMTVSLLAHFANNSSWFDTWEKSFHLYLWFLPLIFLVLFGLFSFLHFCFLSSRTECQKVKNKWLFKLFKHIIKTSSLILVWYYLVTLSSLKLRNKIWLVLYHSNFFKIYKNVYNLSSTCCGLGILYPSWSELAIFLPSIRGYGESPEI